MKQIFLRFSTWWLNIEFWAAIGLAGLSMVIPQLLPFALMGLISFAIVRYFRLGFLTERSPADIAIILLLIPLPFTLWATSNFPLSLLQVERLLVGIVLYYAIINYTNNLQRLKIVLLSGLIAGLLLVAVSTILVQWSDNTLLASHFQLEIDLLNRLDLVNPNVMAGVLALFFPFILGFVIFSWRQNHVVVRILSVIFLVLAGTELILLQSRGALVGVILGTIFLVILRYRWGWVIVVTGLLIGGVAVSRFGWNETINLVASGGKIDGLGARLEVWSRAIYMVEDFPYTGIGMGTFTRVVDALYPLNIFPPGSMEHAHNLLLQIGADLGIPGLIGWFAVFLCMLFSSWKIFTSGKKLQNTWMMGLGAGILASQLVLILHGVFDAVLWGMVRSAPMVWFFWGLIGAGANLSAKPYSRGNLN